MGGGGGGVWWWCVVVVWGGRRELDNASELLQNMRSNRTAYEYNFDFVARKYE